MLENFSFLIDNQLAGCARPGDWSPLSEDLQQLRHAGITALVTLTESPLPLPFIQEAGLAYLHIPVPDFTAPTIPQFRAVTDFVNAHLAAGTGAVAFHCRAGIGRTGTMLAAYLISQGLGPDEAIDRVRQNRPGSIETPAQVQALHHWALEINRPT